MKGKFFGNLFKALDELLRTTHVGNDDSIYRQQLYNIRQVIVKNPNEYVEINTIDELINLINKTDLSFIDQTQRMFHRLHGGPSCDNTDISFKRLQMSYVFNYKSILDLDLDSSRIGIHNVWQKYDKLFLNKLYRCILSNIELLDKVTNENSSHLLNNDRLINKLNQMKQDFEVYSVWRGLVGLEAVFDTRPVAIPPRTGMEIKEHVSPEIVDKRYRNFTNSRYWRHNKDETIELVYLKATLEDGVIIVPRPKDSKITNDNIIVGMELE